MVVFLYFGDVIFGSYGNYDVVIIVNLDKFDLGLIWLIKLKRRYFFINLRYF